jgi:hypothetical protein
LRRNLFRLHGAAKSPERRRRTGALQSLADGGVLGKLVLEP